MIRIAHVIPGIYVGGTEQMVLELCRHRDRRCFECLVATREAGVVAEEIRQTGTPVYTGPAALPAAGQADLINLHTWGHDPGLLEWVQATGKPFVITLHSPLRLPRVPTVVLCTSESAYRLQPHRDNCVVVPNGVDLSRFAPPRERQREEIILTRICRPSRCAVYFWEAMQQILDRYPQTRLWIAGNPAPCRWRGDQVRFLGIRRDVPQILAETDIFVYTPYPHRGTRDLVTMEASAAGVPCVVSDVSAVQSVVHGESGFRTAFGVVDALVEKIGLLVEDAALRAKMSRAALQIAREQFDIRDVARRYELVYRAVLNVYGK